MLTSWEDAAVTLRRLELERHTVPSAQIGQLASHLRAERDAMTTAVDQAQMLPLTGQIDPLMTGCELHPADVRDGARHALAVDIHVFECSDGQHAEQVPAVLRVGRLLVQIADLAAECSAGQHG